MTTQDWPGPSRRFPMPDPRGSDSRAQPRPAGLPHQSGRARIIES